MLSRAEYIKQNELNALRATMFTPILPSVSLAQGILESNNGNSGLTLKSNNHHGIKVGTSWKGPSLNMNTREVINDHNEIQAADWRVYKTAYDSYKDHAEILSTHKNFIDAGVTVAKTPEEQIAAIKAAGYATDPNYVPIIISIIDSNGLRALDEKKKSSNGL